MNHGEIQNKVKLWKETMPSKRFTMEQIINKLREVEIEVR
jgi:hypothetical protein